MLCPCGRAAIGPGGVCGFCAAGPSLLTKAVNLAASIAQHVLAGMPTVTEEVKAARLAICAECPEFNRESGTCKKCGCCLQVKTSWSLQKCPLGKW
jgi:uncharacterized paraquat-inducible protein A